MVSEPCFTDISLPDWHLTLPAGPLFPERINRYPFRPVFTRPVMWGNLSRPGQTPVRVFPLIFLLRTFYV